MAEETPDLQTTPRQRRRRPEPVRTAPHRHVGTLLRDTVAGDGTRPAALGDAPAATGATAGAAGASTSPSTESPVALGVRLGYQVIEEQILQGQNLAQRLGRAAGRGSSSKANNGTPAGTPAAADAAGAAPADDSLGLGAVTDLMDRVVHLYKDLGALCIDAVETLVRNPALRAGVARLSPAIAAASAAASGGSTGVSTSPAAATAGAATHSTAAQAQGFARAQSGSFAVDILCNRRTQVRLDLLPHAGVFTPLVHALYAADPAVAPLTAVRFNTDGARGDAVLQLSIADSQPAALYSGLVVDAHSNEPRGSLSVRLLG